MLPSSAFTKSHKQGLEREVQLPNLLQCESVVARSRDCRYNQVDKVMDIQKQSFRRCSVK